MCVPVWARPKPSQPDRRLVNLSEIKREPAET